ncbi:pentatricopeptide repeat-containing protein At3g26540-like isoform X3 [Beta vulgaris subsp. vulgaris]|uniref:pentatricopeptide repeat-containing protein At3g26540-like isoform X3 n=1 Tax=Beta vulgaris subsp. vulgaris TaxID=3555 RepID=UPI0020367757|nr:pentatricopeptide repeat-containing protein At3g26540-like isoform X3 [Beta vulgaris subsp. vulgaris]
MRIEMPAGSFTVLSTVFRQALLEGIQIHGVVIKCGYEDDAKVGTSLFDVYVKFNDVTNAQKIFDQLNDKDLLSWTSILSGYAMAGRLKEAQELFDKMPERSIISWNAMLAGYRLRQRSSCLHLPA